MRVAIVCNMWPTARRPWHGIFVARSVEALRQMPDLDIQVRLVRTTENRVRYITEACSVHEWLRRVEPDVVHYQYGLSQLLAPAWRGPSVVTFHGSDLEIVRERLLSLSALALAPQRGVMLVRDTMSSRLPQRMLPRRLLATVSCGVDTSLFQEHEKASARRLLGMPEEGIALLFPSSPARVEKNYPLFLRVCTRVGELRRSPVVEMALAGVPPQEAPLRFAAADAVVLTSLNEGSPVVVKEALACRRPVVSTPVGDVSSYTRGTYPCAVASGWNEEELARLVVEALETDYFPDQGVAVQSLTDEARQIRCVYGMMARAERLQ